MSQDTGGLNPDTLPQQTLGAAVAAAVTPEEGEKGEALTLKQIWEKYPRMWIAILVTKRDANKQPIAGKVIAADVDRYRLRDMIVMYKDICIFFSGESPFPLLL